MASVTSNQEDCAIPETPTVVGSPGNCGNALDLKEEISKDEGNGAVGNKRAAALLKQSTSVANKE